MNSQAGHIQLIVKHSIILSPGSIDEVEQMVHMTWVQPRVLDLNQVDENTFICFWGVIAFVKKEAVVECRSFVVLLLRTVGELYFISCFQCHNFQTSSSIELFLVQPWFRCCYKIAIGRKPLL